MRSALHERRLAQEALRERLHDDDGDASGGEAPPTEPRASQPPTVDGYYEYTPRGLARARGARAAKGRGKGGLSSPPVGGRGKGWHKPKENGASGGVYASRTSRHE